MTEREWYDGFKATLINRETRLKPKVRMELIKRYSKAMAGYKHNISAVQIASRVISDGSMRRLYREIYKDIFVGMGRWSQEKEVKTFSEFLGSLTAAAEALAEVMYQNRGKRVLGHNRDVIAKTIELFRSDPEFINLGEQAAKRRLMDHFTELSDYQARRIIRTEATNAANAGVLQTSKLLFPDRALNKKWISANDDRTRKWHRVYKGKFLNGTDAVVPESGTFLVGGEAIPHPGAGEKPSNNIFCRCVVAITRDK